MQIEDLGAPHIAKNLPDGKMGIFAFAFKGRFLQIGRVGHGSSLLFKFQHYHPKSTKSNLAKQLLGDSDMTGFSLDEDNVGAWIRENCRRVDVIVDIELGYFALYLFESALKYHYQPKYEGHF